MGLTVRTGLRDLISPIDWDELLRMGDRVEYRPDTVLIHQGMVTGTVFVLLAGKIKVFVDNLDGRSVTLAVLGPGQVLGHFEAPETSVKAQAGVMAMERVVCSRMAADRFHEFLHLHSGVAVALARVLASQLAAADRRRSAAASGDLPRQLAAYLIELAPQAPGPQARIDLSQDELAGLMSTSRDSAVRALGKLRALGLVVTQRRAVIVPSPERLARFAGSTLG